MLVICSNPFCTHKIPFFLCVYPPRSFVCVCKTNAKCLFRNILTQFTQVYCRLKSSTIITIVIIIVSPVLCTINNERKENICVNVYVCTYKKGKNKHILHAESGSSLTFPTNFQGERKKGKNAYNPCLVWEFLEITQINTWTFASIVLYVCANTFK